MAKKKSTAEVVKNAHEDCIHCSAITDRHLNNTGKPILGECLYSEYLFLLREKVICEKFKKKRNASKTVKL